MKTRTINGDWVVEIIDVIGQYIRFETHDGIRREGRLSSVKTKDFLWNGKKVSIPIELEFNSDQYDTVSLDRLVKLEIVKTR